MDKMVLKITGSILSIAILLITGLAKATRLPINSASISTDMGWFFQLVLNVARFNSNWKSAVLSLLTGDAMIGANPVRAILNSNNITGNELNSNFPLSINNSTNSRQSDVISNNLSDIGYFRHRFT